MNREPYKFSHRAGGRLYWKRRAPGFGPAFEEVVSCNALWFFGQTTNDETYPPCDGECAHRGSWGATGIMPPGHILVVTKTRQFLAHIPECGSRGPRIGEEGTPLCHRPKGHKGLHKAHPEDGWGDHMTWGLPLPDGRYL